MKSYQTALKQHLGSYKKRRLGVRQNGVYVQNGERYPHILPRDLKRLNILESIRSEFFDYLAHNTGIKLHRDFHHLNSSQALTFNLFFPFRSGSLAARRCLATALGTPGIISDIRFEHKPATDGTSVDAACLSDSGHWTYCEVKLSESQFGIAKADAEHRAKLRRTYAPQLAGHVPEELLDAGPFFASYQILRNVWLLSLSEGSHVAFVFPAANASIARHLNYILSLITPSFRARITSVPLEALLDSLRQAIDLEPRLHTYIDSLAEKYVL